MKSIKLLIACCALLFASCEKVPVAEDGDDVLVLTLHNKASDFSNYKTFYINDTIFVASDSPTDPKYINNAESDKVNTNIVNNLTARGFVQVAKTANPDFVVNNFAIKNINVETIYPGYWYGYYWYPYGFYYPWSYTYAYKTGSFVTDFVDLKNKPVGGNTATVIWSCYLNGYVDASVNALTVNKYINQGFAQSEYIKTN